ncbi:MAG: hypothetical protein ACQGVK_05815 [Myxococcota bacterium]
MRLAAFLHVPSCFLSAALLALLTSAPASAGVEVVDFEDVAHVNEAGVPLGEEYAALGVHFHSEDDASVWDGVSLGDPGGWQVEGSSGPRFLGFDGASYAVVLGFDAPVEEFQLDLTRAAPHPFMAHQALVVGLREGEIVDEQVIYLGAVNSWITVELAGELDQVVVDGPGQPGTRFAIDNLQWLGPDREEPEEPPVEDVPPAPEEMEVRVDVRKGSWLHRWHRGRRANARVVVHGAEGFDVTTVDVDSLVFEPEAARIKHRSCPHLLDVDRDGHLDMFLHLRMDRGERSLLWQGDTELCLSGETDSGVPFSGCDALTRRRGRWSRDDHGRHRRGRWH